jgi:DNA replication and repair protein RecF
LYLTSIKLTNFRNLRDLEIKPTPTLNLIVGNNGAGKTSILEAIFYACTAKSFRGASEDVLLRKETDVCRLAIAGMIGDDQTTVEIAWGASHKRQIKIDGVLLMRVTGLFDYFHAVSFVPEDTELVFGPPGVRRRMLDLYLSQADRSYLSELLEYNRVLAQRNALLKEFTIDEESASPLEMLEVWDSQLAAVGAKIIGKRMAMITATAERLAEYYRAVESGESKLRWEYETSVAAADDGVASFLQKLTQSRKKDLYFGSTSVGPHRDDLRIVLNDNPTRDYASQGEAKSATLALKFTIFDYLTERLHDTPILLLDELTSDLDRIRLAALTRLLPKLGQVFLTTTKPLELLQGASIQGEIKIEAGTLLA